MAKRKENITPKRGDLYLVNFDPTMGAEIRKTRPALVLQNDVANTCSPITIVAAITSHVDEPLYPTEVLINSKETGLAQDSVVLLNQIRSIDKERLIKHLGSVSKETLSKVDHALEISLGMVKI
jgi:mRNA interferase MazF